MQRQHCPGKLADDARWILKLSDLEPADNLSMSDKVSSSTNSTKQEYLYWSNTLGFSGLAKSCPSKMYSFRQDKIIYQKSYTFSFCVRLNLIPNSFGFFQQVMVYFDSLIVSLQPEANSRIKHAGTIA